MIAIERRWMVRLRVLPLATLLGLTSIPLFALFGRFSSSGLRIDWFTFGSTIAFAIGGAAVAVAAGGMLGILLSTRAFPGRRWFLALSVVPIAAPPAFWWIGATRLPTGWADVHGLGLAAIATGLALSPITLLLVVAALRQMPSNIYQSARIALPPIVRIRAVLIPLLIAPLAGGFLLTVILLLGESEIPFLFGFRTVMTDVVTTFAQTFDVRSTVPSIVPLLLVILVLGGLAGRVLLESMFAASRGEHGVVRVQGSMWLTLWAAIPAVGVAIAIVGYSRALFAPSIEWSRLAVDPWSTAVSIAEPVGCAWTALLLTVVAAYPARRSKAMHRYLWAGLLLFCVPAGIYAIGWLAVGQSTGGMAIPPAVAHTSRAVALCTLGFAVGYSRLPPSIDDAAALVPVSHVSRASLFVLPLLVPALAASAALSAALTYADRDVGSMLLPPGASRLTLNLYLASANAPSAAIGVLALAVLVGAALTVGLAAAGPAFIWGRRRG